MFNVFGKFVNSKHGYPEGCNLSKGMVFISIFVHRIILMINFMEKETKYKKT